MKRVADARISHESKATECRLRSEAQSPGESLGRSDKKLHLLDPVTFLVNEQLSSVEPVLTFLTIQHPPTTDQSDNCLILP